MENYNEKLIWGIKSGNPYDVERLVISSSHYGYNLFDRKNNVNLLTAKSKETCEEGKNLLLANKFDLFEGSFKERVKNETIINNKIFIAKEKHGDHIFSIPTLEDLYKVSLYLLEERVEIGYIERWDDDYKELGFTESDIEILLVIFQEDAKAKLKDYKENQKVYKENNIAYDLAIKAIDKKDGALAWKIIQNRNGIQYESFEIVEPTKL